MSTETTSPKTDSEIFMYMVKDALSSTYPFPQGDAQTLDDLFKAAKNAGALDDWDFSEA